MNLEMDDTDSVVFHEEIINRFGFSDGPLIYISSSVEEDQQRYLAIKDVPGLVLMDGLSMYLPPISVQKKRAKIIKDNKKILNDLKPVSSVSTKELFSQIDVFLKYLSTVSTHRPRDPRDWVPDFIYKEMDFSNIVRKAAAFILVADMDEIGEFQEGFFTSVKDQLLSLSKTSHIILSDIPADIMDRYKKNGKFITKLYGNENSYANPLVSPFQDKTKEIIPNITGSIPVISTLMKEVAGEGKKSLTYCFLAILLILFFFFRNVADVLISLIPLVFGMISTVGIICLLGLKLNVLMIIFLPLIMGIGIDNGIHILHRFKDRRNIIDAISAIGPALGMTTFTTVIGFGSLVFSRWNGFVGLGLISSIGIISFLVISLTSMPSVLVIIRRYQVRHQTEN
ncbi:MAG: MMPL family transporter [Candidatus Margulisbacteria bacterium]|nr:MMPL family transporter [Candidatus Margulisiibacteriota bacterium]